MWPSDFYIGIGSFVEPFSKIRSVVMSILHLLILHGIIAVVQMEVATERERRAEGRVGKEVW